MSRCRLPFARWYRKKTVSTLSRSQHGLWTVSDNWGMASGKWHRCWVFQMYFCCFWAQQDKCLLVQLSWSEARHLKLTLSQYRWRKSTTGKRKNIYSRFLMWTVHLSFIHWRADRSTLVSSVILRFLFCSSTAICTDRFTLQTVFISIFVNKYLSLSFIWLVVYFLEVLLKKFSSKFVRSVQQKPICNKTIRQKINVHVAFWYKMVIINAFSHSQNKNQWGHLFIAGSEITN